ncbi:hypothetical protein MHYP_G00336150 [Metynnis hypsauchen]
MRDYRMTNTNCAAADELSSLTLHLQDCNQIHGFGQTASGYAEHVLGLMSWTQVRQLEKGLHESTEPAYGTRTPGSMLNLGDLMRRARGSLRPPRKLISFSVGRRQGQSLHIKLDRRAKGKQRAMTQIEPL